jgi:SWI/SNF-related matrix-associated actin-dependent regulator of chromatin subfamily A3
MRSQTGVAGTSSSPKKGKGHGGRPTKETAKAVKLREIMDNMAQLDDSSRRETLLNSLCGQDVLELPLHPSPPDRKSGLLHTNLLKHQVS